MENFEDILQRRLRARGLGDAAQASYLLYLASLESDGRFAPLRWRDGTLTIRARDAIAAHELRVTREELAERLRVRFGWPAEQRLRIRIVL